MEANEITEDPQATKDAKKSSSKDPSAENLQEPTSPETALELSSSQASLQPPDFEALFGTSASPNPDTEASEDLWNSSLSEPPLHLSKSSQSVASLEKAITEIPLENSAYEILISKVQSPLQSSPTNTISVSSYKLSFDKAPLTQAPESEHFLKHPSPGPSTQATVDTSSKREEAEEDALIVGTSDVTAHAATPHASKKKEKRVSGNCPCISPRWGDWAALAYGYTSRPVVPAKRAELVDVAKAMHREKFGAQVKNLFQWEKDSALKAIQTGLYIGWRCPHYLWDCFRIGDESKCFCGHLLKEHQIISDLSVPCSVSQCRCLMFCFIPSRPEEVGEFWLKRRATFDPKAWRAQCRCKHTHEEHAATGTHPCRHRGCCCNCFESNFLCAACDRRWEEHETFFETEETRRRGGRPCDTVNNWHRPF
ncbi:Fam221b [Phodopus roborovskii]|uniref:Fam221b protein n=1 Tax=Phodopus roborovskii TaxID=109678 RepID=A0AAU9ZCL9_PHORO|nr:Fam221b [Phodopus roborovskii]